MSSLKNERSKAAIVHTNMLVFEIITKTDHLLCDAKDIVARDAENLPSVLKQLDLVLDNKPRHMKISYYIFDALLIDARFKRLRASI